MIFLVKNTLIRDNYGCEINTIGYGYFNERSTFYTHCSLLFLDILVDHLNAGNEISNAYFYENVLCFEMPDAVIITQFFTLFDSIFSYGLFL